MPTTPTIPVSVADTLCELTACRVTVEEHALSRRTVCDSRASGAERAEPAGQMVVMACLSGPPALVAVAVRSFFIWPAITASSCLFVLVEYLSKLKVLDAQVCHPALPNPSGDETTAEPLQPTRSATSSHTLTK